MKIHHEDRIKYQKRNRFDLKLKTQKKEIHLMGE